VQFDVLAVSGDGPDQIPLGAEDVGQVAVGHAVFGIDFNDFAESSTGAVQVAFPPEGSSELPVKHTAGRPSFRGLAIDSDSSSDVASLQQAAQGAVRLVIGSEVDRLAVGGDGPGSVPLNNEGLGQPFVDQTQLGAVIAEVCIGSGVDRLAVGGDGA